MKQVRVGMIGTGWAGAMHARAYHKIYGVDCRLETVCSLEESLPTFANEHGFSSYTGSIDEVLGNPDIDVIDIITPPSTHAMMMEKALLAGKHVICEKPLTGYFGRPGDCEPIGSISKEKMFHKVLAEINHLEKTLESSGKSFFYAENWIYSPPFVKMCELLMQKRSRILYIEGFTGHKGSHAPHAPFWSKNGGGTLIRQGTHPLAASIYLKRKELAAKGEHCTLRSVFCDTAVLASSIAAGENSYIAALPGDVEDWGQIILTFSDGTKASIVAGDMLLSGIKNLISAWASDAVLTCNMTPNNLLETYFSDDRGIENAHIMEKNDSNSGLNHALVEEEFLRGYQGELQDFIECIASGKAPQSDFSLAKETLLAIYGAYLSAEKKQQIDFEQYEREIGLE